MGTLRTLLIDGWNDDARDAARALTATGAFEVSAIADRSGLALVDARRMSGARCSQFVGQTIDTAAYDAVLLASSEHLAADAARAARRGAMLIVIGDLASGAALHRVAEIARANGVPLLVMRPALHDPGIAELLARTAMPTWTPRTLDITVEAPANLERLLPTANMLAARLSPGRMDGMVLGVTGSSRMIASTIETDRCFISLRVRHAPTGCVRIAGDSLAGAFDLRIEGATGRLSITPNDGLPSTRVRRASAPWSAEAARIASASDEDDRVTAMAEASLQVAIEAALDRDVEPAPSTFTRPRLALLRGTGTSPDREQRPRTLHLVGAP